MRILLLGLILASLCVPAVAQADARVSAFYYPWYETAGHDGVYAHWSQRGHAPPDDIASAYYPARGLYSSADSLVVAAQMDEIRGAGIGELDVSWWGRGSQEDVRLPLILADARADGITVAAHIEPYEGRTVAGVVDDVAYLRGLGIRTVYVYRAFDLPVVEWAAAHDVLHQGGMTLFAQTALAGAAAAARFDGLYTYDIVTYRGSIFRRLCDEAHAQHLLCAPSVGPGYDARRGSGDPVVRPRRHGGTYDAMWRAAISAHADRVTITSYNEWHEGTQLEPAAPGRRRGRYRYLCYDGAWGVYGVRAEFAYLNRTRYWADVFASTSAEQPRTRAA